MDNWYSVLDGGAKVIKARKGGCVGWFRWHFFFFERGVWMCVCVISEGDNLFTFVRIISLREGRNGEKD